VYLNKPWVWSQPTEREHEISQSWNHLEARVGKEWLNTMMGKFVKGDMDPHNTFCSSHFPERVDRNWLTGVVCESKCVWGSWDPLVLGG
jgi:hypothetical protein